MNVLQRSVGFGRSVLLCRWLEPESLGHWEMAFGFLLMAAPLAVLGLPGSFGRYLVRYRERGQLRLFLRRTACWTLLTAALAILVLLANQAAFARLIFGSSEQTRLVLLVAACLAAVILHHFFEAVFAGLQLFRVVSAMQFCQSMVFAASALGLMLGWRATAEGVIVGYAAGCVVSTAGVVAWAWLRGLAKSQRDADPQAPPHREFWPPLMRFAAGVWVANLLSNLFSVIDRYMILHWGAFETGAALESIGNYHTSTIVPVLLVSVANLLVGAMTPHLSHDWERGDTLRVANRLNRTLQLVAVSMLAAGVVVLVFCPWLFRIAFDEKYAAGLAVLPWTVASCVWFALLLVAQTYTWCAERTRAAALPLALGLGANVALNAAWLPSWGLAGAVAATAVATLISLMAQLAVNQRLGMRLAPSTAAACLCPALLVGGAAVAAAGACGIALAAGVWWAASRSSRAGTPLAARRG